MLSGTTVDRASQGILGGVSKRKLILIIEDPGLSRNGLLTDLSGNDFHMQIVGPILTLAGTDNRTSYLTFDGSDDYARLTTNQTSVTFIISKKWKYDFWDDHKNKYLPEC